MHIPHQRERQRGKRGREELDLRPEVLTWMGEGERGIFQRKERSSFLNGLNRTRMREEETVGEEVVREEGEVWKDFLKYSF